MSATHYTNQSTLTLYDPSMVMKNAMEAIDHAFQVDQPSTQQLMTAIEAAKTAAACLRGTGSPSDLAQATAMDDIVKDLAGIAQEGDWVLQNEPEPEPAEQETAHRDRHMLDIVKNIGSSGEAERHAAWALDAHWRRDLAKQLLHELESSEKELLPKQGRDMHTELIEELLSGRVELRAVRVNAPRVVQSRPVWQVLAEHDSYEVMDTQPALGEYSQEVKRALDEYTRIRRFRSTSPKNTQIGHVTAQNSVGCQSWLLYDPEAKKVLPRSAQECSSQASALTPTVHVEEEFDLESPQAPRSCDRRSLASSRTSDSAFDLRASIISMMSATSEELQAQDFERFELELQQDEALFEKLSRSIASVVASQTPPPRCRHRARDLASSQRCCNRHGTNMFNVPNRTSQVSC